VAPVVLLKVPSGQLVQGENPVAENCPTGQSCAVEILAFANKASRRIKVWRSFMMLCDWNFIWVGLSISG
jgi:predicted ATPase